ncbi:hypothetical protein [Oryzihumus leptocrescens]|uniref:Lipoprotein n=1 Tax=Oryzihumus leptocrescens TaxID=297536 RepID=A0A542ZMZ2_9MICO|nr:hypothetical protein [Oryzihumus leptocrescens]TQL61667.1 hypothetical protein FB474_3082 [Oryzihumus leptocrescens]
MPRATRPATGARLRVAHLAGPVVPLVAAVVLAGCGEPHPSLGDLKATPGARLTYPGAVEYQRDEEKARNQVDGPSPATITVYACTRDAPASVEAWFARALTARGWAADPGSHQDRPGAFEGGTAWKRGNASFDLSFATRATADVLARRAHQPTGCPSMYQTLTQIG